MTTLTRLFTLITMALFAQTLTGCSSLLFYPYKHHVRSPESLDLLYQNVTVTTRDKFSIHGWLLPAPEKTKGSIYFLHGNAENISTHIESVKWLPAEGYQVYLIDYRGFGKSEGSPSLPEVFLDIEAGFNWLIQTFPDKPVFLLGQSIGSSLGVYFAATNPVARQHLAGVISDSAFTEYYEIVRHAAASAWVTWPLQHLVARLMNYPYNPLAVIDRIAPIPLLIIHGSNDSIIPVHHAELLFAKAKQPKKMLITEGDHIQTFTEPKNRQFVLDFLNRIIEGQR